MSEHSLSSSSDSSSSEVSSPTPCTLTEYQLMYPLAFVLSLPYSLPAHSLHKKELHRAQTRARMSRYHQKVKELPPEEQEQVVLRAREARARYRERHHAELLKAARTKRMEYVPPSVDTYAEKYGEEALQAKLDRKRERQLEKQERQRRRDRVKPSKPARKNGAARPNAKRSDDPPRRTPIVHPYQYVYPCRD
ncbi:hypothetical protein C8R47DRAFT_1069900 [Mycena vitilis]|nr:hypothetical protein C8R47DRAFT_1069900 [Mycena vitilis]